MPTASPFVNQCLLRSRELLVRNATGAGVRAALVSPRAEARNYDALFGRDVAICALGMIVSGDPSLVEEAAAGLRTLARHQAGNGQIAKYVKPSTEDTDFWYVGCIDATLWWLAAVRCYERMIGSHPLSRDLLPAQERALAWLRAQEHPRFGLVQQNEASDWADIMPRSGFVLYSNALWFWVKRLFGLPGAETTREHANLFFDPFRHPLPEHRRTRLLLEPIRNGATPSVRNSGGLLSFVNFSFWGEEGDVFGNILAGLVGLVDEPRASRIADHLLQEEVHRPHPVRAVVAPIERHHDLWRPYMQRHEQNHPLQYHNGGSWPLLGGFWVLLLERLGRTGVAARELEQLAAANAVRDWAFHEWFHGGTGEPSGMAGQSWNAAAYLLAYRALHDGFRLVTGDDAPAGGERRRKPRTPAAA